ncbi:Protein DEK [Hondaea fermentalgiana]|uniref:Protein DEK n=1 Tax=Hondaea fermentalgiana TaxID=2315210 RepID=A0A2R5GMC7_9STRA|nr:Protein DEK [Hondaea fermentalgiana]|eukprot:GBG31459.1 Protein DEK [Hondaea fermentalgiana]
MADAMEVEAKAPEAAAAAAPAAAPVVDKTVVVDTEPGPDGSETKTVEVTTTKASATGPAEATVTTTVDKDTTVTAPDGTKSTTVETTETTETVPAADPAPVADAPAEKDATATENGNGTKEAKAPKKKAEPKTPAKKKSAATPEPASGGRRSGRARKQVDHFVPVEAATKEEVFEVPTGSGTAVSEMKKVKDNLSKFSGNSEEIKALHSAMYGRRGKKNDAKKNVLAFSGLVYPEGVSKEEARDRVFQNIGKWQIDFLRQMIDVFGVDRTSKTKKEDLLDTFIDWLEKPTYNEDMKGAGAKAKKAKAKSPAKKATKRKSPAKAAKSPASAKKRKTTTDKKPAKKADKKEEKPEKEVPEALVKEIKDKIDTIIKSADRDKLKVAAVRKQIMTEVPDANADHKALIHRLIGEALSS